MGPLGRLFCDRQDAGVRPSWRLRGLRTVAVVLMLALAWPVDASDDAPDTLRVGGDANYPPYQFIDEDGHADEIGRAPSREKGWHSVSIPVVPGAIKKKKK